MFEEALYLASFGFFRGGGIGDLLNYWEQLGFFSYILPFLLIFALVYVTINNMGLFRDNKGVSAVIALCVGLLALQFDAVSIFFSEIFPRVGIALSIMLAVLIITGLFLDPRQKWTKYMLLGMSVIALFIVLFQQAYSSFWYEIFYFFDAQTFAWLMMGLIVVVLIFAIIKPAIQPRTLPPFNPLLFGQPQARQEGPMG
ncbi:MAG: hypothetical protein AABY15_05010 [Nanoarchaeota archaeon]